MSKIKLMALVMMISSTAFASGPTKLDISKKFENAYFNACAEESRHLEVTFLPEPSLGWSYKIQSDLGASCTSSVSVSKGVPKIHVHLESYEYGECNLEIKLSDGRAATVQIYSTGNSTYGGCN